MPIDRLRSGPAGWSCRPIGQFWRPTLAWGVDWCHRRVMTVIDLHETAAVGHPADFSWDVDDDVLRDLLLTGVRT